MSKQLVSFVDQGWREGVAAALYMGGGGKLLDPIRRSIEKTLSLFCSRPCFVVSWCTLWKEKIGHETHSAFQSSWLPRSQKKKKKTAANGSYFAIFVYDDSIISPTNSSSLAPPFLEWHLFWKCQGWVLLGGVLSCTESTSASKGHNTT